MADGEFKVPKAFKNKDAFRVFVETKVEEAFKAFFIGISMTPEQKAATDALCQWCAVKLGVGLYVNGKTEKKLEKWNRVMKEQHKAILGRRIEWHLKSILKASQEKQ